MARSEDSDYGARQFGARDWLVLVFATCVARVLALANEERGRLGVGAACESTLPLHRHIELKIGDGDSASI